MTIGNERALWAAVVQQALTDATVPSTAKGAANEQRKARDWFKRAGPDFRQVCTLAGLDPESVHDRALPLIEEADRLHSIGVPKPPIRAKTYAWDGKSLPLSEWSKLTGIRVEALRWRLASGWPLDRVLGEQRVLRDLPGGRSKSLANRQGPAGAASRDILPNWSFQE